MWIGVGRLVLDFYNNTALKAKRSSIELLCKDLRKSYNLSALEVADFDELERCVIGFAAVMPQNWTEKSARNFVQKICKSIDESAFARVTVEDTELYSFGDEA